jgi:long-chain acyl-CoA synthetase
MNIAEKILSRGDDSAVALIYGAETMTYAALRDQVTRTAAGLLSRGHVKGDRIGLCSENSSFFVAAYLGIIRAGLVAVPFQTDLTQDTFGKIVAEAGLKEVLASKRQAKRLSPWATTARVPMLTEVIPFASPAASAIEWPAIDPARDLAALMFTSGSTGAPKGVVVSHRNIECNTEDIISYLGLAREDRVMVVLPFHYCFGASLLHTHLMAGASLVLNNNFKLFPETVLQEMLGKECTGLAGVPSTYQILLRKSRFRQLAFPRLRWLQQAGGKLPNACIGEIQTSFPQVRYYLMYGQTEATARLSYLPPERLADKLGSIGKGLSSTRLEVVKPDGTPVRPGSEETGEIVASGDNITQGYWNDPHETAKYFRDGRLHTGDIARMDSDGFIYIVEREREMIKSGGNRVSAKEVEDVIAEIPVIVEVAVVGLPHELLGESINAFVVVAPHSTVTPEDIQSYCNSRLPLFKVPERVFIIDAMPHNGAGKVVKAKLREAASLNAVAPATI